MIFEALFFTLCVVLKRPNWFGSGQIHESLIMSLQKKPVPGTWCYQAFLLRLEA
jgi:hypothetical protein